MKIPPRLFLSIPAFILSSCIFSEEPVMGGFGSRIGDPLDALEGEPEPTPPNPLYDPVILRNGAINFRWTEDLSKSSNNPERYPHRG